MAAAPTAPPAPAAAAAFFALLTAAYSRRSRSVLAQSMEQKYRHVGGGDPPAVTSDEASETTLRALPELQRPGAATERSSSSSTTR
jgi:hypothetical protein